MSALLLDPVTDSTNVAAFYQSVRQHSLSLVKNLSAEDCALQAAAFTSPAKWHMAHTTWFFETFILKPSVERYVPFNEQFQVLFNSYYNGIGEQYLRPKRHLLSRPSFDEVLSYRQHVDEAMLSLMLQGSVEDPESLESFIQLGLHHEMQHQELLLMDLKYCFFQNPLYPRYQFETQPQTQINSSSHSLAPLSFHPFSGGQFEIGFEGKSFHFDNEGPRHIQYVADFEIANRAISNGEYLEFMEDGGYDDAMLWLSDGWAWINNHDSTGKIDKPLYWVKQDGQWFEFTLHGLQPLDFHAPVCHISFYEAHAYSQWAGKRLLTEAEWEVAAPACVPEQTKQSEVFHPTDTSNMYKQTWAWTTSSYQPYPGFKAAKGAVGEYNGKFMCNQMVLRGGCALTPSGHVRNTYRNFFYPQDRWPMTGIWLAQ